MRLQTAPTASMIRTMQLERDSDQPREHVSVPFKDHNRNGIDAATLARWNNDATDTVPPKLWAIWRR